MGAGMKSTRGWDDQKEATFLQRSKEDAHDYRYFPEPDLIPVVVDEEWKQRVAQRIPELPMQLRARYEEEHGLPAKDASALVDECDLCRFFEKCIEVSPDDVPGSEVAKWLLNAGARVANERGTEIQELGISPSQLAGIINLRSTGSIGSTAANELFEHLCDSDDPADVVAESRGLLQVNDPGALAGWVEEAIQAQPDAAADFAKGKDAAIGRLVGHVMKASGGQADAGAVRQCLLDKLRN